MTTSGVISGLDTVQDVIRDALIELQVISANQQVKPADAELARRRLNWLLKQWQDDGCNLWRTAEATLTYLAGTAEMPPNPRLVDVEEVRVVTGPSSERPLHRVEWANFASYPNKTAPGTPTIYIPKPGLDALVIRLWPVPLVDTVINFSGARVIQDVGTDLTQTLDVPQQYTRTVMMNLAAVLAPAFGRAADPNAQVTMREAARLYQIMRATDRPASYFMQPDGASQWP